MRKYRGKCPIPLRPYETTGRQSALLSAEDDDVLRAVRAMLDTPPALRSISNFKNLCPIQAMTPSMPISANGPAETALAGF